MRAHSLALACLLAACAEAEDSPPETEPFPVPEEAWDIGDPSPEAQELLAMINRMRADPAAEVDHLLAAPRVRDDMARDTSLTESGLRADFAAYAPVPPLAFDARLLAAAVAHAQYLVDHPEQRSDPHREPDPALANAGKRAAAQQYFIETIGENAFACADASLAYNHAAFAVDWGETNRARGHRLNLLDLQLDLTPSPKRDAGIAALPVPDRVDCAWLLIENVASELRSSTVFLTGAVFADANGDGFYQAGEGMAGVDVVPDQAAYHAITSASGGYAIPFTPGEGHVRVQLQKAGKVIAEAEATIEDVNVALDFALQP